MNKKFLASVIFLTTFTCACPVRSVMDDAPMKFTSPEAGFTAMFPCDPKTDLQTIQEKPKVARTVNVGCEYMGVKFTVSLSEDTGAFDESRAVRKVDEAELALRESLGKSVKDLTVRNASLRDGTGARVFELSSGDQIYKNLHVQDQRGVYNVRVQAKGDNGLAKDVIAFERSSEGFFASFELQNNAVKLER